MVFFRGFQRAGGRVVQQFAGFRKAGAVTGTVPGALVRVPFQCTAHMRAPGPGGTANRQWTLSPQNHSPFPGTGCGTVPAPEGSGAGIRRPVLPQTGGSAYRTAARAGL